MNRVAITNNIITNFQSWTDTNARTKPEKVLKISRTSFDIRERGDFSDDLLAIRLAIPEPNTLVDENKATQLSQGYEARIYVKSVDSHSGRENAFDRCVELADQFSDWVLATSASDISADVCTMSLTGIGGIDEEDGMFYTQVNFELEINL